MAKIKNQYGINCTIVNNEVINNENLSWKARGIYVYLQSKDYYQNISVNELVNNSTDDENSIRKGLKELVEAGYLERYQKNHSNSHISEEQWVLN